MGGKERMIKVKTTKPKQVLPKKNITVTGVKIVDGVFVDEEGSIANKIAEEIGDKEVTIKISVELDEA